MKEYLVAAASVVLMTALLSGCGGSPNDRVPAQPAGGAASANSAPVDVASLHTTQPWQDEIKAAASAGNLGAAGSPCSLPITFDLEKGWKPTAVDATTLTGNPLVDALGHRGDSTLICEIDGKPAGHLGFIRIWANAKQDATARQALDNFLASNDKIRGQQFREIPAGPLTATEVVYSTYVPALEDSSPGRTFAVTTSRGPVLIDLGGLTPELQKDMLPAYVLARQSIKTS